jgi:acyl-CoA synthetase (AMP-forming)/AMP-acid ligase II
VPFNVERVYRTKVLSAEPTVSLCSLVHGRPSYEVGIVDPETGADQPVSVPGEILVRGYIVTPG